MAQSKRKQKTKLSTLASRLGIGFLCLYLIVSLVSVQIDIVTKQQQLNNINQQVSTQQASNEELRRTLETDNEAAYMERLARDRLGYALPGERIFVDMSGK